MIRLFFLLILFVTMISMILHVSAGWAWIIALLIIAGVVTRARSGTATRYVRSSAMWKCPYCLKRTKLGATACHHCGRDLIAQQSVGPEIRESRPNGVHAEETITEATTMNDSLTRYLTRRQTAQALAAGAGVLLLFVAILWISHSHGAASPPPAAAAASTPAQIVMLHGASADNYCEESPSEARIYVSFTLRNNGDTDGTVTPWATFDYSDGGSSTENFFNPMDGHDLTVPAHTEVDATFYHTYNPQQHSLIRCTGLRDLTDTSGYYLPIH